MLDGGLGPHRDDLVVERAVGRGHAWRTTSRRRAASSASPRRWRSSSRPTASPSTRSRRRSSTRPMARRAEKRGRPPEHRHHRRRARPCGGPARPTTSPPPCAFLCSDDAGYITGQQIGVNGGVVPVTAAAGPRLAAAARRRSWDDDEPRGAAGRLRRRRRPTGSSRRGRTRSRCRTCSRTLMHHPALAGPFLAYNGVLLFTPALDPRLRELDGAPGRLADTRRPTSGCSTCAWRTGCGVTDDEIDAIADRRRRDATWTPLEADLLAATDELIDDYRIDDATWARLAEHLDERQLVEVVFVVGTYTCLAMAFNSFGLAARPRAATTRGSASSPTRRTRAMARFEKPPEGSWTEHYPELGTGPVSYEDSISPEFYELEREAIFKRAWLNVGRVEQLPAQAAATSPRSSTVASTSVIVVRGTDGEVRAFHNICRHRGNKLVWTRLPARGDERHAAGSSPASTTAGATTSTARCTFVQQEDEFFDLDKADYGLVPVHCDVWEGFIFVNLDREPRQSLREFLGPMIGRARGLPVRPDDRSASRTAPRSAATGSSSSTPSWSSTTHPSCTRSQSPSRASRRKLQDDGFEALALRASTARTGWCRPSGRHGAAEGPRACVKPIERRAAQRPVRPVGRARPRLDAARRASTRRDTQAVGPRLVPVLPELRDPDLGAGLVPHVPLLADVVQHAHLRGHALLRAAEERARAPRAGAGRGHVQGVRAAGRQHARGDADDARVAGRRPRSR